MSEINQSAIQIMSDLKTVQCIMKRRMHNYFRDLELTAPQGMLMLMVSHHNSLKISEISEKMGLSNSTVSGIIDRLESQGYVQRVRSKADRRIVNVTITEKMKTKVDQHENILDTVMTEALMTISDKELHQVSEGMKLLSEILLRTNEGENNPC